MLFPTFNLFDFLTIEELYYILDWEHLNPLVLTVIIIFAV